MKQNKKIYCYTGLTQYDDNFVPIFSTTIGHIIILNMALKGSSNSSSNSIWLP